MNRMVELNRNLSDSAADFATIVWPAFATVPEIGGGEIRPVESDTETGFARELDMRSGIDAWQLFGNAQGMRGIASRVQWSGDYRSFTIRYKYSSGQESEYFKRLYAIENAGEGILYPHLTIQAFLSGRGGALLSAAAIPTRELILHAKRLFDWGAMREHGDSRFGLRTGADGTCFIYLSWDYILHSQIAGALIQPSIAR